MTTNRRDFLKIAGASALTLMAPSILRPAWAKENDHSRQRKVQDASKPSNALTAKRWAMAVDPSKCSAGCTDCIAACHAVHNVPEFGNPKDEVKWIWTGAFCRRLPR